MTNVLISAAGLCGATIIGAIWDSSSRSCPINGMMLCWDIVPESCWQLPRWD